MREPTKKHWSIVEYLHESVRNPNIHVRGTHSYYSNAWTGSFEESVVRYHYGDEYSLATWEPQWPIDQLHIGDYVCIGAEAVILMGGNHTHRTDWFSLYPHLEHYVEGYVGRGDTQISDGSWIGMRAMLMPGVVLCECAIVASGAVVTRGVEPYTVVAGNPARPVKTRFPEETIARLLALDVYHWSEEKFVNLKRYLCAADIGRLEDEAARYDEHHPAPTP